MHARQLVLCDGHCYEGHKPCGRGQSEFPSRGRFDRLEEAIRRAMQWVNGHRADNRN